MLRPFSGGRFGALAVLLSCVSARKETLRGWLLAAAEMLK